MLARTKRKPTKAHSPSKRPRVTKSVTVAKKTRSPSTHFPEPKTSRSPTPEGTVKDWMYWEFNNRYKWKRQTFKRSIRCHRKECGDEATIRQFLYDNYHYIQTLQPHLIFVKYFQTHFFYREIPLYFRHRIEKTPSLKIELNKKLDALAVDILGNLLEDSAQRIFGNFISDSYKLTAQNTTPDIQRIVQLWNRHFKDLEVENFDTAENIALARELCVLILRNIYMAYQKLTSKNIVPTRAPITLYRGVAFKHKPQYLHQGLHDSYNSFTTNPQMAIGVLLGTYRWKDVANNTPETPLCCIYKYILPAGSRPIFMFSELGFKESDYKQDEVVVNLHDKLNKLHVIRETVQKHRRAGYYRQIDIINESQSPSIHALPRSRSRSVETVREGSFRKSYSRTPSPSSLYK